MASSALPGTAVSTRSVISKLPRPKARLSLLVACYLQENFLLFIGINIPNAGGVKCL
jgi:hypothetical protein